MNSHQRRKQRRRLKTHLAISPLSLHTAGISKALADAQKKLAEYIKSPEYQLQMRSLKTSIENLHTHFVGVDFKPFVNYVCYPKTEES